MVPSPLVAAGPDLDLDTLLGLVDDRLPADVEALTRLFCEQHPRLLEASEVHVGPQFDRTADLRGADADLISTGCCWR